MTGMITRLQNGFQVVDVKYQGSVVRIDRGDARTNMLRVGLQTTEFIYEDSRADARETAEEIMDWLFIAGFKNVELPVVQRYSVRGPVAKLTSGLGH